MEKNVWNVLHVQRMEQRQYQGTFRMICRRAWRLTDAMVTHIYLRDGDRDNSEHIESISSQTFNATQQSTFLVRCPR